MRAIDADVLKQHIDKLPALPDGNFAGNHSALKALINMQPTIEPSTNCSEFPNNSDTISREAVADVISRQQAIDALERAKQNIRHNIERAIGRAICEILDEVENGIKQLPPIQPEIVRCKDCKHWIPYDWMFSEVWQSQNIDDYPEDEIGCNISDMSMKANDFCSRAERREVTT